MDIQKNRIRNLVNGVYDIQKLRISTGNRIVASLRPETDTANEDEATSMVKLITDEYTRITDLYVSAFSGRGSIEKSIAKLDPAPDLIKSRIDYELVQQYLRLVEAEDAMVKIVEREVKTHPMWDAFFKGVKGCGPLMSAVCIAYFDPHKARHASSFWRYAGLDVQPTESGEMRGVGRWYTEMRPYTDRDGDTKERKSLTYNPFLKTKLVGVLGSAFLRARDSYYGKVYYDYKNRMEQRENLSPIVRHRRATRYAVKMFLRDMWVVWRELEGLEVTEPYEVAKLGHKPHHSS